MGSEPPQLILEWLPQPPVFLIFLRLLPSSLPEGLSLLGLAWLEDRIQPVCPGLPRVEREGGQGAFAKVRVWEAVWVCIIPAA